MIGFLSFGKYLLVRYIANFLSVYVVLDPSRSGLNLDLASPTAVLPLSRAKASYKESDDDNEDTQGRRKKSRYWCRGAQLVLRHILVNRDYVQRLVAVSSNVLHFSEVTIDEIVVGWTWSTERTGSILGGWADAPKLKIRGLKVKAHCKDSTKGVNADAAIGNVDVCGTTGLPTKQESKIACGEGAGKRSRVGRAWKETKATLLAKPLAFLWSVMDQILMTLALEVSDIEISLQLPLQPTNVASCSENSPPTPIPKKKDMPERVDQQNTIVEKALNLNSIPKTVHKKVINVGKLSPISMNTPKTNRQPLASSKTKLVSKINNSKRKKGAMHSKQKISTRRKSKDSKARRKFRIRRNSKRDAPTEEEKKEEPKKENLMNEAESVGKDLVISLRCKYVCIDRHIEGRQIISPVLSPKPEKAESRKWQQKQQNHDRRDDDPLAERLSIGLFSIHLIQENSHRGNGGRENDISGCILRPFSYNFIVMHIPTATSTPNSMVYKRRLDKNVELIGQPIATYAESMVNGYQDGISVHVTETQMAVLSELGKIFSSSSNKEQTPEASAEMSATQIIQNTLQRQSPTQLPEKGMIFWYAISIESVSIVLSEKTYVKISNVDMIKNESTNETTIQAVNIFVGKDETDSEGLAQAYITDITTTLSSNICVVLHSIEALYIPGRLGLSTPLHRTTISFEEGKLHVDLTSPCKVVLIDKEPQKQPSQKVEEDNIGSSGSSVIDLPFPIAVSIPFIEFKRGDRVTQFSGVRFGAEKTDTPSDGISFTVDFSDLQLDDLLKLTDIHASGRINSKGPIDIMHELHATLGDAFATKGFSRDDWNGVLLPKFWTDSKPFWLPFANISSLKMHVCVEAGIIISKESVLSIGTFTGGVKSTIKDVQNHYVQYALKNTPRFLSSVSVFGHNVSDNIVLIMGQALYLNAFGPFGGAAAIITVDGVKGAVAKGKQRRGASPDDFHQPGDFFRGILSAKEEIGDGKLDLKDTTVDYFKSNKAKLAGGAAGGTAFLVGTALGGPVLGIIAGVVVGRATRRYVEKRGKNCAEKDMENPPHQ